jgi:hypothetical protein
MPSKPNGGWYVTNISRASGTVGCVAKIADGKWAIACGEEFGDLTFSTRPDAAKAELILASRQVARDALRVIALTLGIAAWLGENDRKALEQVWAAIAAPEARQG